MPKRILHFIKDAGPTAQQSDACHKSRAAGNAYTFVSEQWALENEAVDCDEIVTDSDVLKMKYEFD